METFEKLLCTEVSKFVKKNINHLIYEPSYYAFKSKRDMVRRIQEDFQDACWALTELLMWGMGIDNPFICNDSNDYSIIYCIKDSKNKPIYFEAWLNSENKYTYSFKKPVEKTIIVWEDVE